MLTSKKGMSALQIMRYMGFGPTKPLGSCATNPNRACRRHRTSLAALSKWTKPIIGGKDKNRHWDKRSGTRGRGYDRRRPGCRRSKAQGQRRRARRLGIDRTALKTSFSEAISNKVSLLCTDAYAGYKHLGSDYPHGVVDHSGQYVVGAVHTNTIEGFWSLIKRGIIGSSTRSAANICRSTSRSFSSATITARMRTFSGRRSADAEMKIFLGIFICIVLLLGFVAWLGYSAEKQPAQETDQTDAATNSHQKDYSSIIKMLQVGSLRIGKFISRYREEIAAIGTFWIAIFTVILGIATVFLYLATRELVQGAEKTAERQLRAYIYIHPVTLYVFTVGAHPAILLSAKNYGTTPTRNGRVRYGFAISPPNDEQDYTVPEDQMVTGKQPLGFPSKGDEEAVPLRLAGKNPTTEDEFLLVSQQHHVVVLKGTFIYEDIFKIERHTRFCYAVDWEQINSVQISPDKQLLGGSGAHYCQIRQ